MARPKLRTALCDRLGIEYPIVLAGMGSRGRATPPALVAAVSEAGGLGVVGGSGLPPEALREQIRETRKLTARPIGVDLILPGKVAADAGLTRSEVRRNLRERFPEQVAFVEALMQRHGLQPAPIEDEFVVANTSGSDGGTPGATNRNMIQQQVDVIMEEDVQVFAAGLGDPAWVVPLARARGMQVIGLAGSARNALRQKQVGVDIIVAQGHEAGGHTGRIASFPLIPQVVDAVAPTPVLAAGGIVDGRGVAAALALGAQGVWIGTAFLASSECAISDEHKRQIVEGRSQDFEVRTIYTGKTMRSFKNAVIDAWDEAGLATLPVPYQKILMDDLNAAAAAQNRYDLHSNPAGQGAGLIDRLRPAAEIMQDLVAGTLAALNGMHDRIQTG
ncbi:MAG: nitronate monooxygenase [Gammaproteobacteria bacterium]|nr:nitronate monooxygenase [Gammaproteobacteria bacterium]